MSNFQESGKKKRLKIYLYVVCICAVSGSDACEKRKKKTRVSVCVSKGCVCGGVENGFDETVFELSRWREEFDRMGLGTTHSILEIPPPSFSPSP